MTLQEDEDHILAAAASNQSGDILRTNTYEGEIYHAGGQSFGSNAREQARLKAAVQSLAQKRLVERVGNDSWRLTADGWNRVDEINAAAASAEADGAKS